MSILTPELIERCMKCDPAQIGHFIQNGYMNPAIGPVFDNCKIIGPAFTVRITVNDSAMLYYAMGRAPKGSIIVIDRGGDKTYAAVGEMVMLAARTRGIAGIVIDGPNTDVQEIRKLQFPVFSTGLSAVTTGLRGLTGEYDIPIQCGGAVVKPGDIIFGDDNGVIVIPPDKLIKLIETAEAADAMEVKLKKHFSEGKYIDTFLNINNLVETNKEKYFSELLSFDDKKDKKE